MVHLTAALVLFAAVSAGVGYLQWKSIDGQLQEMKSSGNQIERQIMLAQGQLIVAGRTATYQQSQADAAQKGVAAIQHQTFQLQRPWITVDVEPLSGFSFQKGEGGGIPLKIILRNTGHSVAQYVSFWAALQPDEEWKSAQQRLCRVPRLPVNAKSDYGYLIFPGQTITDMNIAQAPPAAISHTMQSGMFGGKMIELNLVLCVDYQSPIAPGHHQTRRALRVSWPDPSQGGAEMGAFEPGRQYPKLIFQTMYHGDSAD
jgi:hypothetical protein